MLGCFSSDPQHCSNLQETSYFIVFHQCQLLNGCIIQAEAMTQPQQPQHHSSWHCSPNWFWKFHIAVVNYLIIEGTVAGSEPWLVLLVCCCQLFVCQHWNCERGVPLKNRIRGWSPKSYCQHQQSYKKKLRWIDFIILFVEIRRQSYDGGRRWGTFLRKQRNAVHA